MNINTLAGAFLLTLALAGCAAEVGGSAPGSIGLGSAVPGSGASSPAASRPSSSQSGEIGAGWWCWNSPALPGAHPSPYVLKAGIDHPCTAGEVEASGVEPIPSGLQPAPSEVQPTP
jgi:hypothetical protein